MFEFEIMAQAPEMSKLVQSRYDAIIAMKIDGSYEITTLKNKEFQNALTSFMEHKTITSDSFGPTRNVGTNIIGYMLMFLLVQGVLYARFFAEDKEKRMVERVAMSPISFVGYIIGHGLFVYLLTVIPSFLVVTVASLLGMNVGFSMFQYLLLLAVVSLLSTAFAMCLNSFFCVADTANMVGSSIIILTCILAGTFYSFTKESSFFDKITHILPQKDFMNYVNALEQGSMSNSIMLQLTYVIGISIVFFLIAVIKTRISYVRRK
jgi:ABC-2 type transport system permease protein